MTISSASNTPRLRLTRRGRAVFTTLAATLLAAGALAVASNAAVASEHSAPVTFEQVTVHAGESLWQLAQRLDPDADPRDVVSDIVHLNQLPGADVHPGQLLAVPAQYSH
jgi:nucleoid-associated protein YgaU